ncbi:hypothetical protein ABCR94_06030 [Streptomyces sp. 21So2-11]|uniref:hypothetical protein n=1 Tax=Streptomyces sp. 21So2-11 TaxID=3144408 RepID=UPI00321AA446
MAIGSITTPERFGEPLYEGLDDEVASDPRDFTVTIAGGERHDGEKPYTYVVRERMTRRAWAKALAWHMVEREDIDAFVVTAESHEGLPPHGCGYSWNDLRSDGV